MKQVRLVHNPGAGDGEYNKKKLIALIEQAGFQCRYSSTKDDNWKDFEKDDNLIVVAGGDGSIRKVVKQVLSRNVLKREITICIIPLGTANNIANTLGIGNDPKDVISVLQNGKKKLIDVAGIYDIEEEDFFIESYGYGVFPYLMQVMKKSDQKYDSADDELRAALKELHRIVLEYEPRECTLEIDGSDHSGKFLLAEVMNTKSIGPNLILAPNNDPGDGELQIVLVTENQKEKFAAFVSHLLEGGTDHFQFFTMPAKEVKIKWNGSHVHVDDKVVKLKDGTPVDIQLKKGILKFLVPDEKQELNNQTNGSEHR